MNWKRNPQSINKNEKFKKLWNYKTASKRSLYTTICVFMIVGNMRGTHLIIQEKKVQKKRNTDWLEEKEGGQRE